MMMEKKQQNRIKEHIDKSNIIETCKIIKNMTDMEKRMILIGFRTDMLIDELERQMKEYQGQNERIKEIFRVKETDIFEVAHQYFGIKSEMIAGEEYLVVEEGRGENK